MRQYLSVFMVCLMFLVTVPSAISDENDAIGITEQPEVLDSGTMGSQIDEIKNGLASGQPFEIDVGPTKIWFDNYTKTNDFEFNITNRHDLGVTTTEVADSEFHVGQIMNNINSSVWISIVNDGYWLLSQNHSNHVAYEVNTLDLVSDEWVKLALNSESTVGNLLESNECSPNDKIGQAMIIDGDNEYFLKMNEDKDAAAAEIVAIFEGIRSIFQTACVELVLRDYAVWWCDDCDPYESTDLEVRVGEGKSFWEGNDSTPRDFVHILTGIPEDTTDSDRLGRAQAFGGCCWNADAGKHSADAYSMHIYEKNFMEYNMILGAHEPGHLYQADHDLAEDGCLTSSSVKCTVMIDPWQGPSRTKMEFSELNAGNVNGHAHQN